MTGNARLAQLSKKQAARRPKPPLPKPASCSASSSVSTVVQYSCNAAATWSSKSRFSIALPSARPIKNSRER